VSTLAGLSRRERQIMDILYRSGKASASEVREAMRTRLDIRRCAPC
jgi:predicted transcriptional regulator